MRGCGSVHCSPNAQSEPGRFQGLFLFLWDISDVTEILKVCKQLLTNTDLVFVKQVLLLAGNMNFLCSFGLQIFKLQGTTRVPLYVLHAACHLRICSVMMPSLLVKAAKYVQEVPFPSFSLPSATMKICLENTTVFMGRIWSFLS